MGPTLCSAHGRHRITCRYCHYCQWSCLISYRDTLQLFAVLSTKVPCARRGGQRDAPRGLVRRVTHLSRRCVMSAVSRDSMARVSQLQGHPPPVPPNFSSNRNASFDKIGAGEREGVWARRYIVVSLVLSFKVEPKRCVAGNQHRHGLPLLSRQGRCATGLLGQGTKFITIGFRPGLRWAHHVS